MVTSSFAIVDMFTTAEDSIELLVAIIACKNSYQIATVVKQSVYLRP